MKFNELFRKKSTEEILKHGDPSAEQHALHKVLSVRDLTFFGIAAIIGGGTFSAIGNACYSGGPAVILLYIICAIACGFTAMCYAEFASRVPASGSAYTYAYVSFGEMFAWIIGWALLMEYSIGNIYIAFSWSGYFTNLLDGMGAHISEWLTINYQQASSAFSEAVDFITDTSKKESFFQKWMASTEVTDALASGRNLKELVSEKYYQLITSEGYHAWTKAPNVAGLRIIFDLPAVLVNAVITALVYLGTKESRNISNLMVIIKLAIIALVIGVGFFYIDVENWTPFMPNGFAPNEDASGKMVGVLAGVSAVFFAFIGFDAVSTLAEETKNPQRDLPRGMIYSLVICTVIFIILCLILTGMASYSLLGVSDPLAEIFKIKGVKWMLFIVSIAAVVAMASVLLVFQMGQPRIWMAMSRDGLLPKKFASIHPKFKTPGFSTIITGFVVGVPLFFTNETFVLDFTSIGTLFAFVLVCGGVLLLPRRPREKGKFHLPYINSNFVYPVMLITTICVVYVRTDHFQYITNFDFSGNADYVLGEQSFMDLATPKIASLIFWATCIVLAVFAYLRKFSLLPLLGLISCLYLLTGMTKQNWAWFLCWLLIGLVVYLLYGFRKSKLAKHN